MLTGSRGAKAAPLSRCCQPNRRARPAGVAWPPPKLTLQHLGLSQHCGSPKCRGFINLRPASSPDSGKGGLTSSWLLDRNQINVLPSRGAWSFRDSSRESCSHTAQDRGIRAPQQPPPLSSVRAGRGHRLPPASTVHRS